jgi:hexosaminidase
MSACNALSACVAFNTNGYLKNGTKSMAPSPGSDLWVKNTVQQPSRMSVWPKPVSLINGSTMLLLDPSSFTFTASNPSQDLTDAFTRYQFLIFNHQLPSEQFKRVIFNKDQASVTQLVVNVTNTTVPLQLNVDESYTLHINLDGSALLSAATVYGAYRGLETFSQLIRFDFDLQAYRLDFAPLTITDSPKFAWRGLLIDTSRHFEPVGSIFRIIEAMSYAKVCSTLH